MRTISSAHNAVTFSVAFNSEHFSVIVTTSTSYSRIMMTAAEAH